GPSASSLSDGSGHYAPRLAQISPRSYHHSGVPGGQAKGTGRGILPSLPQVHRWCVTVERCLEAYHLQRTRFDLVAEPKLRRRQLADDGNVEIGGRDLRERQAPRPQPSSLPGIHWAAR